MQPIESRNIAYILAVNAEHSFSRAAEKYYISQPALSKAVSKVEQQLGIALFDRSSIPLKPTAEGERIIAYFQRIQDAQSELSDYCEAYHRKQKSDLRIGAPSFFCTYVLPPMIAAFQAEHPAVTIRLIEANDHDLREFLQAGAVDVGLSVEGDMPSDLESFVQQYEQIILAVPKALPINEALPGKALSYDIIKRGRINAPSTPAVPLSTFAGENFIFLRKGNDMYRRGYQACLDAGFEPKISIELDQLMTAYYLAEAGQGVAFIRSDIPCYVGKPKNLLFYKIDHPSMTRPVRVLLGRNGSGSQVLESFLTYLKNFPSSI